VSEPSETAETVDVAIVGGGPVGVMEANFCGVHGLSAAVFDREADIYQLPRAAGLHDDAQRILHNAGVLDAVLPGTGVMAGAEFMDADRKRIIGIEFPEGMLTPNGYPVIRSIHQPGLEEAIRSCLARYEDVNLHTGHEVAEMSQDDDGVDLVVRDLAAGGTRRVRARWLIGCDGATSAVRKWCGISWDSLGYDHEWLVIDVVLHRDVDLPIFCQQVCDPKRPTTFVPMPGNRRRWEFQLKDGETREEMEDRDRIWELLESWMSRDDGEIARAVVYRFHATIAETFQHGRVFLAGDAAHQTPPFMGQGLCTGVRDTANLIWKLAAVRHGQADSSLLDSYSAERHPLAVAMVQHSINTGKLIDAYADMAQGGPEPPAELQEYAYGGSRVLPDLSEGFLDTGDNEWVGQLVPQNAVCTPEGSGRFDDVVGPRWAIVSSQDPTAAMSSETRRFWDELGAMFVTVAEPEGAMLALLMAHDAVVVRPDRIIYSVTTRECRHEELERRLWPARALEPQASQEAAR